MTQERIENVKAMLAKYNRMLNKSKAEDRLLRACRELLEVVAIDGDMLKAEYDRGYEDGKNDEIDRAYRAKKKTAPPPVEPPKAEVETLFEPEVE